MAAKRGLLKRLEDAANAGFSATLTSIVNHDDSDSDQDGKGKGGQSSDDEPPPPNLYMPSSLPEPLNLLESSADIPDSNVTLNDPLPPATAQNTATPEKPSLKKRYPEKPSAKKPHPEKPPKKSHLEKPSTARLYDKHMGESAAGHIEERANRSHGRTANSIVHNPTQSLAYYHHHCFRARALVRCKGRNRPSSFCRPSSW